MNISALLDRFGDISPVFPALILALWLACALIKELRPLVVQLYALRGTSPGQRARIISALAQLHAGDTRKPRSARRAGPSTKSRPPDEGGP